MEVAKIKVDGAKAAKIQRGIITAGMVGAQVHIDYADPMWDNLRKTVVFEGVVCKDVITDSPDVEIPPACITKPIQFFRVGVYGADAENNLVIPTLWANIGPVLDAADPSGDTSTDPTLPVWAQILNLIGDLNGLTTEAKNNLVTAINEKEFIPLRSLPIINQVVTSKNSGGVTINKDVNGVPFALRKFYFEVKTPVTPYLPSYAAHDTVKFNNSSRFITNERGYSFDSYLFSILCPSAATENPAYMISMKWWGEIIDGILFGQGRTYTLYRHTNGKMVVGTGRTGGWDQNSTNDFISANQDFEPGITTVSSEWFYGSFPAGSTVTLRGEQM